jgi:hypothetical protein
MSVRKNSTPQHLALPAELLDILQRNGMQAQLVANGSEFSLLVQGHDSPLLTYPINAKQLSALTDWGTNSANRKCYNTFASILAADFDLPKDFVHARNANGRVAMGLHGCRTEEPRRHMRGNEFLGWSPRQQDGYHLRRIGGQLYYPDMVTERANGYMKPGELQSGSYGFYFRQTATAQQTKTDVLQGLNDTFTTIHRDRPIEAKPYKELITSDVYFTNEKWQEVLASHGIVVDAAAKSLTIQSSKVPADLTYDLTAEETAALTNNSIKEASVAKRLEIINSVISADFNGSVTKDMLNSKQPLSLELQPSVLEDLNGKLQQQTTYDQTQGVTVQQEVLPKGTVVMDGNDLELIDPNKGWFREGAHGREVTVDGIRVEPTETAGKYRMTAVIDGETVSHEINQKQYDKFMAIDDFHRMKLFSKIFGEVDMKSRDQTPVGAKIGAALMAGLTVAGELGHGLHGPHHAPEIYTEHHGGERVYSKPGVDTLQDVAARHFDAAVNADIAHHELRHGM